MRKWGFVMLFLFVLPPRVFAQTGVTGYHFLLFPPPADGFGGFVTPSPTILGHKALRLSIATAFSSHTVSLNNPALRLRVGLVDEAVTTSFTAALGLGNRAELGFNLPLHVTFGQNNDTLRSYSAIGIGDVGVQPKVLVFKERPHSPAVAVVGAVRFPSGERERFTGNKGVSAEGGVVVGKEWGRWEVAAGLGYRFLNRMAVQASRVDDLLLYGGNVGVGLPRRFKIFGEIAGGTMLDVGSQGFNPLEANVGVHQAFRKSWRWQAGGGGSLSAGRAGLGSYRLFAGLQYTFGDAKGIRWAPPRREKSSAPTVVQVTVIQFAFYKDTFLQKYNALLDAVVEKFHDSAAQQVKIVGHADSEGTDDLNDALSLRRAVGVKEYLAAHGIPDERMTAEGRGAREPLADNRWREGKAKNRRVEIGILLDRPPAKPLKALPP